MGRGATHRFHGPRRLRAPASALLALGLAAWLGAARAHASDYVVFNFFWIRAKGSRTVRDARFDICRPVSSIYQDVRESLLLPDTAREVEDPMGRTIWRLRLGDIRPGLIRTVALCAWIRPRAARVKAPRRPPAPLSARQIAFWTRDEGLLRMTATGAAAREMAGAARGVDAVARSLYYGVVKRFVYDIDGRWDSADEILRRRRGSCSELAALFVSMCRNLGIPARRVSATVLRAPGQPCFDVIHHVWAEYFSPRYGWAPVDCSRGLGDAKGHFRRQDSGVMALVGNVAFAARRPLWRTWKARGKGALATARVSLWLPARKGAKDWKRALAQYRSTMRMTPCELARALARARRRRADWALPAAMLGLVRADEAGFRNAARLLARHRALGSRAALIRYHGFAGKGPRAKQALAWARRALSDESPETRSRAVRDIGRRPCPEAEALLLCAARDDSPRVRSRAASALGRLGASRDARGALERLCRDRDRGVARAAGQALKRYDARRKGKNEK